MEILGYTIADPCIQKAVAYMEDCLLGNKTIPDRREKVSDWDVFTDLILATWIRRFTKNCEIANCVAQRWAKVVTFAFFDASYDEERYRKAYLEIIQPKYGRMNGFAMFYPISLLQGCLDESTESSMIRYLLDREQGIYYIFDKKINVVPENFQSRDASRYLAAIELLAEYATAREHLEFVADWLELNRNANGMWDMGKSVNDKVYFPLSDDWRSTFVREKDCTERIDKLLSKLRI